MRSNTGPDSDRRLFLVLILRRGPGRKIREYENCPYEVVGPRNYSNILFDAGPDVPYRELGAAADKDRQVSLVRHRVVGIDPGDLDDIRVMIPVVLRVAADDDDDGTRLLARSPQPLIVMPADGGRKTLPAAEKIDGRGLAIVLSEDRAFLSVRLGQIAIDACDTLRHFRPAELVRIVLG